MSKVILNQEGSMLTLNRQWYAIWIGEVKKIKQYQLMVANGKVKKGLKMYDRAREVPKGKDPHELFGTTPMTAKYWVYDDNSDQLVPLAEKIQIATEMPKGA